MKNFWVRTASATVYAILFLGSIYSGRLLGNAVAGTVILTAFALFVAIGCWFGYDGLVRYPSTPAAALYEEIEAAPPPGGFDVEGFKRQKTQSQIGLMAACLAAGLVVGVRLLGSASFRFVSDDEGFACGGKRYSYSDIRRVDDSKWGKKGIVRLEMSDGRRISLDSWHHTGIGAFYEKRLKK